MRASASANAGIAERGGPSSAFGPHEVDWRPGDVVFCPGRGIGTVLSREKRVLLGARREYLTIHVARRALNIMIPVDEAAQGGLRPPSSPEELDDALTALTCEPASPLPGWKARIRVNRDRLGRGRARDVAEVVRDLAWVDAGKGLGSRERDLYEAAREVLERELAIGFDLDEDRARRRLDQLLTCAQPPSGASPPTSPRAGR